MKLEAYFRNSKSAKKAVENLKQTGIRKVSIDQTDSQRLDTWHNLAGADIIPDLSALAFLSVRSLTDENSGPLIVTNPNFSRLGGIEEITDSNFQVIAEVDEDKSEAAKKILSEAGGSLESPWPKA